MMRTVFLRVVSVAFACVSACSSNDSHLEDDRRAASDLFAAFGAWFAPLEMDEDVAELIDELERHSLTPSRVFQRTEGWTETSETKRILHISGSLGDGAYTIVSGNDETPVVKPGDYRGTFTLQKLRREHEYRWIGEDTAGLGDVPIATLVRIVESVLLALERDDTRVVLDLLPRTRATWGRLATLRVAERRDVSGGGTALAVELEIDPGGIESDFPAFARYLKKFVGNVEMGVDVRDESGVLWMRARFERLTARLEMRSRDGKLAPLTGTPRMLPVDLYLNTDFSTKTGPFRVGFRELLSHLRFERTDERIALVFLSGREPKWRIPFLVKPLFTGALRRPFEGDGLESRTIFARESAGTVVKNDFRLEVEETWLLRRLGGSFGREFDQDVELERRKFYEAALRGLQEDMFEQLGAKTAPHTVP